MFFVYIHINVEIFLVFIHLTVELFSRKYILFKS